MKLLSGKGSLHIQRWSSVLIPHLNSKHLASITWDLRPQNLKQHGWFLPLGPGSGNSLPGCTARKCRHRAPALLSQPREVLLPDQGHGSSAGKHVIRKQLVPCRRRELWVKCQPGEIQNKSTEVRVWWFNWDANTWKSFQSSCSCE